MSKLNRAFQCVKLAAKAFHTLKSFMRKARTRTECTCKQSPIKRRQWVLLRPACLQTVKKFCRIFVPSCAPSLTRLPNQPCISKITNCIFKENLENNRFHGFHEFARRLGEIVLAGCSGNRSNLRRGKYRHEGASSTGSSRHQSI